MIFGLGSRWVLFVGVIRQLVARHDFFIFKQVLVVSIFSVMDVISEDLHLADCFNND